MSLSCEWVQEQARLHDEPDRQLMMAIDASGLTFLHEDYRLVTASTTGRVEDKYYQFLPSRAEVRDFLRRLTSEPTGTPPIRCLAENVTVKVTGIEKAGYFEMIEVALRMHESGPYEPHFLLRLNYERMGAGIRVVAS